MYLWLKKIASSRRTWIAAGALSFGAAIVLGYHEDQLAANRVLAEKVGLPGEVMVQDFLPELHSNIVNEVDILAEAGLGHSARINVSDDLTPQWIDVVPVYAVSREGFALAQKWQNDKLGTPRRPMPRSKALEVRRRYADLAGLESHPLGFLVHEAEGQKLSAMLGSHTVGEGLNGPLVSVVGAEVSGTAFLDSISREMENEGIPIETGVLVISPYVDGREAAFAVPDYGWLRTTLIWSGLAMFGMALATMCPTCLFARRKRRPEVVARVEAVGDFPAIGFFQPIKTQEELLLEDDEVIVRTRQASRVMSRLVVGSG